MAVLQKNTHIANRYGLNIRLCDANNLDIVYQTIDFANISAIDISGDEVFAHGGAAHEKRVGFYNKLVGEFTLSTQILTNDLLCLMTGGTANWDGSSPIVFKNRLLGQIRTFALICETVWQDKNGNVYGEQLILHRVRPRIAYNRKYALDGDVASVDIVFDIMQDAAGQVLTRGEPKLLVAPQNVTADGTNVSWDEVANATSYDVLVDGTTVLGSVT